MSVYLSYDLKQKHKIANFLKAYLYKMFLLNMSHLIC